ncbi:MAG: HAMP domain-containing histidine kinase [Candidatus Gastranaerophilales bacterium]|nr:HAMP domain-containing histidine kinase [Candidatus Gastranaerophilales bacterium]MCM1072187.1 HAMP domain-containing histidine kinase [Bacteroides sp.]
MKKIVRQQNYLKELIETQGNKFLSRQTLKCLIRSALEPLLDAPESGVVFYRIENKEGLQGLLKRLEFSEIESINYSDDAGNLVEKVWANTEFLCVMTHRYVSIILWDTFTGDKNTVRYYSLYNSKLQNEPLDIIKRNSKIDITSYQEKFTPDRRDNILLNASIRRLLDNMVDAADDAVLGYAEKTAETLRDGDYAARKSRVVAHEVRNQLSICDLYTEILRKKTDDESILNSLHAITKAIKMANNSLLALKSKENTELKPVSMREVIEETAMLAGVYLEGKNIELQLEISDISAMADSEKLLAVLINLVKNASEAFGLDEEKNDKYIKIKTEKDEDFVNILVSNNAQGITEPEKIFNEGFTTKSSGSGLGLWICKKSIEEQFGSIELSRSTEDYTEFTIRLSGV